MLQYYFASCCLIGGMDHLEIVQNLESDASDAGLDFSSSEKLFFCICPIYSKCLLPLHVCHKINIL